MDLFIWFNLLEERIIIISSSLTKVTKDENYMQNSNRGRKRKRKCRNTGLRGLPEGEVGYTHSKGTRDNPSEHRKNQILHLDLSSKEELCFTNASYLDWQWYRYIAYTYTHMRKEHVQKV